MRLRIPAVLAVLVVVTACLDPLPVPQGRYGAITAPTFAGTGGGYTVRPQAAFYGNTDLSYVPFPSDTCLITSYSDSSAVTGGLRFLNAGDFLQTSVSGRVDTLLPIPDLNLRVYEFPVSTGIPFTPGDTLTVVVPGASFPASAVSVRTAEAFTHDSITVPAVGAGLNLTWTPAVASGTHMTFSLRYHNGFGTIALNEQIFCSFIDDGSQTIPTGYLDGWRDAAADQRATRVARIRSREVVVDDRTSLVLVSSFARPLPAASAPTIR